MEVDERLVWLISALKAACDTGGVNKEKLLSNVTSCFLRIKKEKRVPNIPPSQAAEDLQDFQVKATVLLLLCLPAVRELPNVKNCAEFQSLISSLPEFSESLFFTVIRTQKIYFLVSPLLSCVPLGVVQTLSREFLHTTEDITPVTLAITVELLRALLYTSQHSNIKKQSSLSYKESLELFVQFLSRKSVSNESPAMVKFSGYLCMYLYECLHMLIGAYVGSKWTPSTFACVKTWTNLWENDESNKATSVPYVRDTIKAVLLLCQKNNVTVDMWLEWSEQMLPQNIEVHVRTSQASRGRSRSIQLVICNIAFDVMKTFEDNPHLKDDLDTAACLDLLQFFQQVAADPDHDPDQDLTLEQLLQEISLKDDRHGKLLGFLVQNNGVFSSEAAITCLREYAAALDAQTRLQLLEHCISALKTDKAVDAEFTKVVLDLAADLTPEQLRPVIVSSLSAGLDETLKTPLFRSQLTAVLNQMGDENSDQTPGRHVWLCLQSGCSVVQEMVQLAVTMSGLVPVMVKALMDIPEVCQALLPSGNTLLPTTLLNWQTSGLSEQEQQNFLSLVKQLLGEKGLVEAQEVMQLMVEPFLVLEGHGHLERLILPLEILKEVMTQDVDAVVYPGPAVVSLALALSHLLDATVCLEGQGASVLLEVRSLASTTLRGITEALTNSNDKFGKETSVLQHMVEQHSLHPMSVVCLARVLDAEYPGEGHTDLLLRGLLRVSPDLPQQHLPAPVATSLVQMSKSEWIIALLQVLPHCSESEWGAVFLLMDYALGPQPDVFTVLEIFEAVAYLVCESLAPPPMPAHPQGSDTPTPLPPVSLHHFFLFFSSAAVSYLDTKAHKQSPRERFMNLADVFRWWCCVVPSICCAPELPTLFLARLCGALEELVVSGKLKVEWEPTQGGTEGKATTGKHGSGGSVQRRGVMENQEQMQPGREGKSAVVCENDKTVSEKHVSGSKEVQTKEEETDNVSENHVSGGSTQTEGVTESQRDIQQYGECETPSVFVDKIEPLSTEHASTKSVLSETEKENLSVQGRFKEIIGECASETKHRGNLQTRDKEGETKNPLAVNEKTKRKEQVDGCYILREPASVSSIDAKILTREIEQMTLCLAKYVPTSSLLASVASKLKKLYMVD